jgi:hypothetical protein
MLVYLDTSVALRAALPSRQRPAWRDWLDATVATYDAVVSAQLLATQLVRALQREDVAVSESDKVASRVRLVAVTYTTVKIAETVAARIKTLDGIHLAAALLLPRPLVVATHDATMIAVARTVGLATFDPVGPGGVPRPLP